MTEVLYYAVPFFVLLLIVEGISFRHIEDDHLVGFERSDTRTSLTMGMGNVIINVGWKLIVLAIYAGLYELAPIHLSPGNPLTWVALFFADDLAYYWFHRVSHENRLFGTYEPENERVRYGLTTNIETFNPVRVAFHEYIALWRDVRRAPTWRDRAGHVWHGPGWTPAQEET